MSTDRYDRLQHDMFDVVAHPAQRVIATTERYEDAEALVDSLASQAFPVEHVAIAGRDLEYVERVTGRLNTWKAALAGASSGLTMGLLFGLLFGFWFAHDGTSLLGIVAYWAGFGALIGGLLALIARLASGGRHNFASVAGMQARRFDVLVDDRLADIAVDRLTARREPSTH
jgi:hypothetical protein